ncbi:gas vesicle protein GvpO [Saccharopolyspora rosea]|uniref:Gas vesicle protein n=1 Tax=Saccharopolyspora rosea TaxID=524884 RepID=A0ABW3FSB9_9PSEU|nr:gas vesicle protein [Saccharopolyspora rosea]
MSGDPEARGERPRRRPDGDVRRPSRGRAPEERGERESRERTRTPRKRSERAERDRPERDERERSERDEQERSQPADREVAEREESSAAEDSAARRSGTSLRANEAARLAVRQVRELTGRDAEGVTALERSADGWRVGVEVVESHRVPDSTDVMAVYEAELDETGELVSYRRVSRYARGHGDAE